MLILLMSSSTFTFSCSDCCTLRYFYWHKRSENSRSKVCFSSCSCQTKSKQTGRYFLCRSFCFSYKHCYFCFMCQKSGCKESSVESRRWQSSLACIWRHPNKHPARQRVCEAAAASQWSLLFGIRLLSSDSTEHVRPPAAWRWNWWRLQHERREENRFCQEHTASVLPITPAPAFFVVSLRKLFFVVFFFFSYFRRSPCLVFLSRLTHFYLHRCDKSNGTKASEHRLFTGFRLTELH